MSSKRFVTTLTLGLILATLAGAPVWARRSIPVFVNGASASTVLGASLALSPSNTSVQVGDIFTMDIVAAIGADTADTVDAYLYFNPTYLEVVDELGTPATAIEPNAGLFSFVTFNSADNTTGQINFSATQLGTPLTGTFTAATIRFKARAAVDATDVVFVRSGARVSDLYQSGEPLNAILTNGTVTISTDQTVAIGSGEVAPGDNITVPLEARDVVNLASIEIEVRYDPSVLDFIACNADPGGALDLALCDQFDNNGVNPDVVRFTAVSTAGISGNIILAEITFQAVGQPGDSSALNVQVFTFDDTQGNPIVVTSQDGEITIGCLVSIAEIQTVADLWHQEAPPPYDCDGDGWITIVDIMCWAERLGETCPQ